MVNIRKPGKSNLLLIAATASVAAIVFLVMFAISKQSFTENKTSNEAGQESLEYKSRALAVHGVENEKGSALKNEGPGRNTVVEGEELKDNHLPDESNLNNEEQILASLATDKPLSPDYLFGRRVLDGNGRFVSKEAPVSWNRNCSSTQKAIHPLRGAENQGIVGTEIYPDEVFAVKLNEYLSAPQQYYQLTIAWRGDIPATYALRGVSASTPSFDNAAAVELQSKASIFSSWKSATEALRVEVERLVATGFVLGARNMIVANMAPTETDRNGNSLKYWSVEFHNGELVNLTSPEVTCSSNDSSLSCSCSALAR